MGLAPPPGAPGAPPPGRAGGVACAAFVGDTARARQRLTSESIAMVAPIAAAMTSQLGGVQATTTPAFENWGGGSPSRAAAPETLLPVTPPAAEPMAAPANKPATTPSGP